MAVRSALGMGRARPSDEVWTAIEQNPYSALIVKIYESLNDVWGFYAAYVRHLMFDEDLNIDGTGAENIEPCLLSLAASKIEADSNFATGFNKFAYETKKDYREWLLIVKGLAVRAGVPLKAELLDLVSKDHDSLGHEAEAESLGFNDSRLHPDVYMNELLCGMRAIHQVLPAIMKKLGIEEEFKLDESEFHAGG
jgi:hypothetical protein